MMSLMPYLLAIEAISLKFVIDTGWPPQLLQVIVTLIHAIFSAPFSLIISSILLLSILPLNG